MGNWVVLLGLRRVGKRLLASCTATKLGIRTVVIDARIESGFARGLVDGLSGYHTVNVGEVLRYVTCRFCEAFVVVTSSSQRRVFGRASAHVGNRLCPSERIIRRLSE